MRERAFSRVRESPRYLTVRVPKYRESITEKKKHQKIPEMPMVTKVKNQIFINESCR